MGANADKIVAMAKKCAWPYGTPESKYKYPSGSPTADFKKAINKAYPDRSKWGKQTRAGASCDVFVGTVVRASGVDTKFPRGLDGVVKHCKNNPKWKLTGVKSEKSMKAGDIVYMEWKGGGHIVVYLGGGKCANAHYVGKSYGVIEKFANVSKSASKCQIFNVYRAVEKDVKPTMKKVLDISNWQGVVAESTFKGMKKDVPMVIIRSSYTHQANPFSMDKDKSFEKNIVNAYNAGMKIGVYHYSQATSVAEAQKEADYVLGIIKRHKSKITMPVVFDYEFGKRLNATNAKKLGKAGVLKVCDGFCNKIKSAGFDPMVYANLNTLNNYISASLPEKWKVWVAQYNDTLDYKKPYYMWQFTSSGRVQGVGGKVDLSYFKGDEPKPHTPTTYKGTFPTLPKRGWFQKGDKGTQVKNLQKLLLWLGYSVGKAGADGEYGKDTASAVLKFEKDYKLKYKDSEWGSECQAKAKTIKK